MGAPVLIGAGLGAVSSLAMGQDPLKGAVLGGVTGGAFGGAEGFGSGFTEGGLFSLGSETAATGLANAPTMGGLELAGAASGTAAASAPVAGATASPYAFGSNAIETTRQATTPSLLTGEAGGAIKPNMLDTFTDTITPDGGFVADEDKGLLDKAYDSVSNLSPLQQTQMLAPLAGPSQPEQMIQPQNQGINPGKPLNVDQTGTGILNIPVSDTFIDKVKRRQLFSQ